MTFNSIGINSTQLTNRLLDLGYFQPSANHRQIIPEILSGKNILINSPLGAGFTEASLLAILHLAISAHNTKQKYCILTPSEGHTNSMALKIKTLIGENTNLQLFTTYDPGNINDLQSPIWITNIPTFINHINNTPNTDQHSYTLLITETNEIIARGEKDNLLLLKQFSHRISQTILCTTQLTKSVSIINKSILNNPIKYHHSPIEHDPSTIAQQVWPIRNDIKIQFLIRLCNRFHNSKCIIFTKNQQSASKISRLLRSKNIPSAPITTRDNNNNNNIIDRFVAGELKILVDSETIQESSQIFIDKLKDISHIVHFDLPDDPNIYITTLTKYTHATHHLLVTPNSEQIILEIEDYLERPLLRNTMYNFDYNKESDKSKQKNARSHKKSKENDKNQTIVDNHKWDPQIPKTWGDRNAIKPTIEKTPLDQWNPTDLPSIWQQHKTNTTNKKWSLGKLPSIWSKSNKHRPKNKKKKKRFRRRHQQRQKNHSH